MPYILNTDQEIKEMLKVVGVDSIEELYAQIPSSVKLNSFLNLPDGLSEFEVKKTLTALSEKNIPINKVNSFLGAGCYDHYVPEALLSLLSSPQFLTAYTPYQAECSQGSLQAIYEYQSYICFLTGMDVSNASLLDGASALTEAVFMALRITGRKKILIAGILHPEYREVLNTYLDSFNFVIQEVGCNDEGLVDRDALGVALDDETACCVFASPNFFGLIEDAQLIVDVANAKGALTILITNPLSLVILKEPAKFGIDIVCGDGQPLGGSLNLGGSSFGFIATIKKHTRQMAGRIVGRTVDGEGKEAYCLTLQTREQHIRREKATSNICSNQSLNAIGAAVYLSLMGKEGVKEAALHSFSKTQYLYKQLKEIRGVTVPFSCRIFNEFVWEVEGALGVIKRLHKSNIIAGYYLGNKFPEYKNGILSCCTEKKSKDDIDHFLNTLIKVLHG